MPKGRSASPDIEGVLDGFRAFAGPARVVIDLTNRCNNNCIACWTRSPLLGEKAPSSSWKSQEFSFPLIQKIIRDLHRIGTKIVFFSGGGDPLMYPSILKLLEYIKSLGMMCGVTTNGTLLDHKTVNRFIDLGLDYLAVSLWAGSPATYARVHPNQTEKTFHRIAEVLHELGQRKHTLPFVTLSNVLFNMNYGDALRIFQFGKMVRVDALYFTLVDPIPGSTDCLLLNPEQRKELAEMMVEIEKRVSELPGGEQIELRDFDQFKHRLANPDGLAGDYDSNTIDSIPCYVGWSFCRLLPDGTVSPCCRGVHKPMGNLFRSSFEEIWHSSTYCEFRYNAKKLKKRHPYFHPIGCYRTCDNMGENLDMHRRILEIFPEIKKNLSRLAG